MHRPSVHAALVLLAIGCSDGAGKQPAAGPVPAPAKIQEPGVPQPPAIGRATFEVGGKTLAVELRPEKSRFMVSEPIYAELVISAAKDAGVEIGVAWFGRNQLGRPENYNVTFVGANGPRPVPDAGSSFGGLSWTVKLAERDHTARLFLPGWVASLAPGHYDVRLETTIQVSTPGVAKPVELVVVVAVPVDVIPDDATALGALIDEIGAVAIGADFDRAGEALTKLAQLRDPRVVPHLVAVARLPDYSRISGAVDALAGWNDDRALAAIVRAGATTPAQLPAEGYTTEALRVESAGQLRHTASVALAASPHPRAIDALLAMKDDPSMAVRLTVLHRVATLPDPTGLAMLQAFLRDPDPTIAGEAKRYLTERGRGP